AVLARPLWPSGSICWTQAMPPKWPAARRCLVNGVCWLPPGLNCRACISWPRRWSGGAAAFPTPGTLWVAPTRCVTPLSVHGRNALMIGSAPRFLSYRVGATLLHRLDPRAKLLGTTVIVANALFASIPQGMIVAYALGAVALFS